MKIALQARSNAVSLPLKAAPDQSQASGTDFRNTLNSAGASVEERDGRARRAQDGRSGEQSNKRKDIQAASSTSDAKSVVSAAPLAVASDAVQAVFNLSSALQSPTVLTTDGSNPNAQGASGETTAPVVAFQSRVVLPADGGELNAQGASDETIAPVAPMPKPMSLVKEVGEAADGASSLNGTVPDKAISQGAETSGPSIQSKGPSHQVAEAISVNQADADSSKRAIHSAATQQSEQVPAVSHSVATQPNDQGPVTSHSTPTNSSLSGAKGVVAQSGEAIKPSTETTKAALKVQTGDVANAVVQSVAAVQPAALPPVGLDGLTPKLDLQSGVAGSPIKAERTGFDSTLGTRGAASASTGSGVKGKDGVSDGQEKRGAGLASVPDSTTAATPASVVAKVSETLATATHGLNTTVGGTNSTAAEMTPQTNQPAISNHEQAADPQASVVSSSADGQKSSGGAATNLQDAPGISSAQVIQSMNRSEMRVGMQSAEFGDISISTSINHRALSAQISIDHTELSKALAFHLPAMEAKLGSAYGMPVRVDVRDGGSASSFNQSGQQSREQRPSQAGANGSQIGSVVPMTVLNESTTALAASSTSRLDIRI